MSRHPASAGGRASTAEYKQELLGELGLRADATDAEVEAAHSGLVEFLELAPHEVRSWAAARTADVDEAFALLSGPERDLVPPTEPSLATAVAQDKVEATPPAAATAPATATATAPATAPATAAPFSPPATSTPRPRRNLIIGLVSAAAAVGIVFGVAQMGNASDVPGITGTPTGQETTAAPSGGPSVVPVDKTKVAALMQKISANPKDVASLQSLGDIYFGAADYKTAITWEQKALVADPKNQVALLALGAAQFNTGNSAEAEKQWLTAAKLYPKVAEVHYDLGFLYMSATPPNKAQMTAEWKKVIAIDPNSNLAKTVAQHLGSATPSAAPSAK
jgi:tetratricopeptide (TPR) repeat protein